MCHYAAPQICEEAVKTVVEHTETFTADLFRVILLGAQTQLCTKLTSGQERQHRDPNCRHFGAMVSELRVRDSVLIDGGDFAEVERSYAVLAVGTERH